ncbi:MAG: TMEM43 family protein [Treponema sp.]|jgi:energy-converting hydrogenase Eha subunit G|nr:TMEM43 family protein [Treponema sp.]
MAYKVTTKKSYGQRLKGSLKGAKTGAIAFALGTILLFINEGNFVKTQRTIGEAQKNLVRVDNVSTIDSSLNGKLIHAVARANTDEDIADPLFGVRENAIAIFRSVEYCQYVENKKTEKKDLMGGGQEEVTTYTYEKRWVSSPVNSSSFADPEYKGKNSVLATVDAGGIYAENVTFGAYRLPRFIITSIRANSQAQPQYSAADIAGRVNLNSSLVQVQGNTVYFGKSSSNPEIGDVKITFTKTAPTDISIIAQVVGSTFEPFTAKSGRTFHYVEMGSVGPEAMFSDALKANSALTWILRIIGVILIIWGLWAIFDILPSLFKVLPILGKIVGAGLKFVCGVGGFAWSLTVIAIAWLFYRPLIGLPLLAVAIGGIVLLTIKSKQKAALRAAAVAAGTTAVVTADGWNCPCGQTGNDGKFCAGCGGPAPAAAAGPWTCSCGNAGNTGKFCAGCGKPQA